MVCPVCRARMLKVKHRPHDEIPGRVRCVRCAFSIIFKNLKNAA